METEFSPKFFREAELVYLSIYPDVYVLRVCVVFRTWYLSQRT